ncbi:MAG: glycosyltransferase [Bacteroidota bacterium]
MNDKPILFMVLSRFPYPLEKGDKLRAFHQIKSLSEHHRIVLCCMTETPVNEKAFQEVNRYCHEIHTFPLTKVGLLWQAALTFLTSKPFQVAYFYRYRHFKKIQQLLRQHKPAHIFCQLLRMAEYVKDYHLCPKTIDYMDALSKGMERRIATEPWYKSWFFSMEFKRLVRYERAIFDYFEHKIIISKQDLQFIHHPKRNDIVVIPNGVDESFFEYPATEKKYDLLFTGNFSYPPNIEGACYLINEILPLLKQRGYNVSVLLSGASPHARVLSLASDQVFVSGWVDDIRASYAQSRIFVAPMFIGTGLQNKLLEAMAMGLPCITTPLANNALGATDGENILLAEQTQVFVEKIVVFLTERGMFDEIGNKGQSFVKQNYSWSYQNDQLIKLLV